MGDVPRETMVPSQSIGEMMMPSALHLMMKIGFDFDVEVEVGSAVAVAAGSGSRYWDDGHHRLTNDGLE